MTSTHVDLEPRIPAWLLASLVTAWRLFRFCCLTAGLALAIIGGVGLWALMDASTYLMIAGSAAEVSPDEMQSDVMSILFELSHLALATSLFLMLLWVCVRGPGYLVADEWVIKDKRR